MHSEPPFLGLAAGGIKRADEPSETLRANASFVTFGSYTRLPWKGNEDDPVTYWYDRETGDAYNAINLTNQGIDAFLEEDLPDIVHYFGGHYAQSRISFAPQQQGDLELMCERARRSPYVDAVYEFEFNAACPNHRSGDGALHEVLAHDPRALEALMEEASDFPYPKAIKIAPQMEKSVLSMLPHLCGKYGFRTIVSANTKRSSTIVRGKKRLTKEKGGRSGRSLFRWNVRQIKYLSPFCKNAGVNLISCGGIFSGEDLKTVLDVGADGAQLMTAWLEHRDNIFRDILIGL